MKPSCLMPVLAWAAMAGCRGHQDADPQPGRAVAMIKRLGGTFEVDEQKAGKPLVKLRLTATSRATNADLAILEDLPELESLELNTWRITDTGLKHLKGLTKLR